MASHLGCDRDPMVIAWPGRIAAGGDLRTQFTHCIDIAPTLLDMIGIPEPTTVDGVAQEPMDGTSFAYTFDDAEVDERHTLQYFEMYGSRAIYQDGWWARTRLDKAPWDFSPATSAALFALRHEPGRVGAELPPRRLQSVTRHRRRSPGEAGRAAGSVLAGGRAEQGAAAARWSVGVLRRPTAHVDGHPIHLPRRRRERLDHAAPTDLRQVLRDRGRTARAQGWRTGRAVRLRRPPNVAPSDRTLERAVSPSTSGPSQPPVASDGRVRANRISTATRRPCSAVPMLRSAPPQHTMGYPSPIRSEAEIRARLSGGIPERSAWAVPE